MSYRDDRDADQSRIAALETELAGANKRIAELEGRREQALVLASGGELATASPPTAAKRWLGAPLELKLSRELPGSFPTDRFEDVIERIRAITRDPGRTEVLKSSLTWSASTGPKGIGPFTIVTVSVRDGVTRLAVTDRLGPAAGAMYGGVGGGAGLGTIAVPIAAAAMIMPLLAPVLALAWIGTAWVGARSLFKRIARSRAERLQQLFDALVEELDAAIPKP